MSEAEGSQSFLCTGCPGEGNPGVDTRVNGSCYVGMIDAFRQTRRYRIESFDDYASEEELIELSAGALRYFDEEKDEFYEMRGMTEGAYLGILCAKRFLGGKCPKTREQILEESDIDCD